MSKPRELMLRKRVLIPLVLTVAYIAFVFVAEFLALRNTVAVIVDNPPGTPSAKTIAYLRKRGFSYYSNPDGSMDASFEGGLLIYLQDEYRVHFAFAHGKVVGNDISFYTHGL